LNFLGESRAGLQSDGSGMQGRKGGWILRRGEPHVKTRDILFAQPKINFKSVHISEPGKPSVNSPRFTTQKPQTHHKKPSTKTRFSQKPPAKMPTHPVTMTA
jgi:hypothetical protein